MDTYTVDLKKDQVLCREGDRETDLYIVLAGSLLICVRKGTQVTAVATLAKGEFMGELSFFDNLPRGADVIASEETRLLRIPASEIRASFPFWISIVGKQLASKIRLHDDVIRQKGVKKSKVETIKPLSIEEQRHYNKLLSN